jgi:hypothetical protein
MTVSALHLPLDYSITCAVHLPLDYSIIPITRLAHLCRRTARRGRGLKQAEQTRGVPLAGLPVKVTPGFYLIGLSNVESDKDRNIQLLKERSWLDIPVVYNNNRRAILALEKGTRRARLRRRVQGVSSSRHSHHVVHTRRGLTAASIFSWMLAGDG